MRQITRTVHLDALDSPRGKLVLLYLHERGPCSPRQLADELDASLFTILGALDTLCRKDLIERDDGSDEVTLARTHG